MILSQDTQTENKLKVLRAGFELARRRLMDFSFLVNPSYQYSKHLGFLAEVLEKVERGEIKKLMIFFAPRHGKSELVSCNFPAWYLGRNPDRRIIHASYSDSLSNEWSRRTRDVVEDEVYRAIFGISTDRDTRSVDNWRMNGKRGGMLSLGVGGSATGHGADCIPSGTMIDTDNGKVKIDDCKNGTRVLSYNHGQNKLEYKPVIANLKKTIRGFTTIATSCGRSLTASYNHPVFVVGQGYTKIQDIKAGARVRIAELSENRNTEMLSLRKRISAGLGFISEMDKKESEGLLLRKGMHRSTSRSKEQTQMFDLRKSSSEKNNEILLKGVQAIIASVKRYSVRILQKVVCTVEQIHKVLFYSMQGQLSFGCYDGSIQLQLQTRQRIPDYVQKEKKNDKVAGYESLRCMLRNEKTFSPSQRREHQKQCGRKFNNRLLSLSHNSSQIKDLTISSVISVDKELEVFDIQVADNHNFFADSFLVHNCFIIDDPIKNAQEAESEAYRVRLYDWYKSVARTRLEPGGAIILMMARWHQKDLAGAILAEDPDWTIINLKAIAGENDPMGRPVGAALWPERFSVEALNQLKSDIGSRFWHALYDGEPVDPEGALIKRQWIQYYETLPLKTKRYGGIDTATSKKTSADNMAMVEVCRDKDKFIYVDDVFLDKVSVTDFAKFVSRTHKARKFGRINLESNNAGDAVKQRIDEIGREEKTKPPVYAIQTDTDKVVRVIEYQHLIENGTIKFKSGNPRIEKLIDHLCNFDGRDGADDDDVDALGFAIKAAESGERVLIH